MPNRYSALLESLPDPVLLLDCSAIGQQLRSASASEKHLPHSDSDCGWASRISIVDMNHALVRFFGGTSKEDMPQTLSSYLAKDSLGDFYQMLLLLDRGNQKAERHLVLSTLDGTESMTAIRLSVEPGSKDGLTRVLLSISELTDSEQTLQRIADLARFPEENPAPVMRIRGDGLLLYANPASNALIEQWRISETGGYPEALLNGAKKALSTKSPQTVELEHDPLVFSFFIVPIENRKYVNMYGMDITERKKTQEALVESEGKYRQLFEANPQPMFVYDLKDLRFLDVNAATEAQYGYSRDEFLSMSILKFHSEDEHEQVRARVRTGPAINRNAGIWRHLRKDGTFLQAEIFTHDIPYDGMTARLVHAKDITDRVKAEDGLRETIDLLRSVVEIGTEASVMVDAGGTIQAASHCIAELLGMDRAGLIGESCTRFVTREDFPHLQQSLKKILQDPSKPQKVVVRLSRGDGSRVWAEVVATGLRTGEEVKGFIITVKGMDILRG
jgi:PAS domain S-box-containing protein